MEEWLKSTEFRKNLQWDSFMKGGRMSKQMICGSKRLPECRERGTGRALTRRGDEGLWLGN